jgi:hypothetical protein
MSQVDLEELTARCRGNRARAYIQEAVDCYRVGAYRAAVITTWIAVVYDIVDKLRELAIVGDSNAVAQVERFDEINRARDLEASLKFERDILSIAKDTFELLTAMEVTELGRLQEDRNRCAHPNLIRDAEIYSPSAELARMHMRTAVDLVVSRPPVQGKAALEQLHREVDSEYFPTDAATALRILSHSPIARAKRQLLKSFVLGALTSCLREPLSERRFWQRLAAVEAVRQMHPAEVDEILKEESDRAFARVADGFLPRALAALQAIPIVQGWLADGTKTKLRTFISNVSGEGAAQSLAAAFHLPTVADALNERIAALDSSELKALVAARRRDIPVPRALRDRAITLYGEAGSFDSANSMAGSLILPLLRDFTPDELRRIIASAGNTEVRFSFEFRAVLQQIVDLRQLSLEEIRDAMKDVYKGEEFNSILQTSS